MFTLERVVPWGRSFDEYCRIFALTDADLRRAIVGCGDGPASFNAEATRRGGRVVSCDPIYQFDKSQIRDRIAATSDDILEQTRRSAEAFVWGGAIQTVEQLGEVRWSAMRTFLEDYDAGKAAGRYVAAELPHLPFDDGEFDLALCSHFLFLYSSQVGEKFHHAALHEMCRVAAEVRVFPLVALDGSPSPFIDSCVSALRAAGHGVEIVPVDYEFQRGANRMMKLEAGRGSEKREAGSGKREADL